jgi:lipid II:glycine glycyltransferase (peptidoglycan interpeptide bridge formation enzyme)
MDRRNADGFYYFSDLYFARLVSKLSGKVFLALAWLQDQIVAAALILASGKWGHYHLSGSLPVAADVSATHLLLFETAGELQRRGKTRFHLGGGTDRSYDNSLFRFKKRFSRQLYDFYVGTVVVKPDEYQEICREWAERYAHLKERYGSRVLCYRYSQG